MHDLLAADKHWAAQLFMRWWSRNICWWCGQRCGQQLQGLLTQMSSAEVANKTGFRSHLNWTNAAMPHFMAWGKGGGSRGVREWQWLTIRACARALMGGVGSHCLRLLKAIHKARKIFVSPKTCKRMHCLSQCWMMVFCTLPLLSRALFTN